MTSKEKKMALYGAIQRLLDKANEESPFTGGEMYEMDDEYGTLPRQLYVVLELQPNCGSLDDWTEVEPELGDKLLRELMEAE